MHSRYRLICAVVLAFLLGLTFASLPAEAKIVGDCDACHAKFPGMMEKHEPGKPLKFVLQSALCVNCHTNADGTTLKELGGMTVPVVHSNKEPLTLLSGGNFHYLKWKDGDAKGHNMNGISGPDQKNGWTPPGYDRRTDLSTIGYNPQRPLTCSGSNGCHGDRNIEDPFQAIMGTHHADDEPIDGSTIAKSYRYLKITSGAKGVLGTEDPRWEHDRTAKTHNEYSPTIDLLCRNCHGNMHGKESTGKEAPWLRHPTGVVLPKRGEYLRYNPDVQPPSDMPGVRVYSTEAPVARGPLSERMADAVEPAKDMVMCLSCHVAHAGPHRYGLRWDYENLEAAEGGKGACFICHTGKSE